MWKWIVLGVAVLAIAAMVYVAQTKATPVEVAKAAEGEMSAYVEERARTTLPRVYHVTMPLAGRVMPIDLEEGKTVEKGKTVLARLDTSDLKTALAAAKARRDGVAAEIEVNKYNALEETAKIESVSILQAVANAVSASGKKAEASKERRDYAKTHYEAAQAARDRKAATKLELERAQAQYAEEQVNYQADVFIEAAMKAFQAASKLMPVYIDQYLGRKTLQRNVLLQRQAEAIAEVGRADRDLARAELRSPITGVVLKRHVSNERVLSAGAALLDLGRREEIEVTADILSQEAVHIRKDNPVEIFGAAIGAAPIGGSVKRVNPAGFVKLSSLGVEQQRVAVIVTISPDALRALREAGRELGVGYRVRVRIHTATVSGAVRVPRTALFRGHAGRWEVFAVRDGRARRTQVTIGLTNEREAQVTAGLSAGDLVVVAPEATLRGGARVSYQEP